MFVKILASLLWLSAIIVNASVVLDENTGLMWQDEKNRVKKDWREAIAYCSALRLSGFENWRLPTIEELSSIIDDNRYKPVIKQRFEHTNNSFYWSSSEFKGDPTNKAMIVYFLNGFVDWAIKSAVLDVRCVRNQLKNDKERF